MTKKQELNKQINDLNKNVIAANIQLRGLKDQLREIEWPFKVGDRIKWRTCGEDYPFRRETRTGEVIDANPIVTGFHEYCLYVRLLRKGTSQLDYNMVYDWNSPGLEKPKRKCAAKLKR